MKSYLLAIGCLFLIVISCTKNELEIAIKTPKKQNVIVPEPDEQNLCNEQNISLLGSWKGTMVDCFDCSVPDYRYFLDVNSYDSDKEVYVGVLRIETDLRFNNEISYADYTIEVKRNQCSLEVKTLAKIKVHNEINQFCTGNTYQLEIKDDNTIEGNWTASRICSTNNSIIKITRQ